MQGQRPRGREPAVVPAAGERRCQIKLNRGRFSYEQSCNNADQKIANDRHYHLGQGEILGEPVPVGVRNVSDNGGQDSDRENETNFPAETTNPRLSEKKNGEE